MILNADGTPMQPAGQDALSIAKQAIAGDPVQAAQITGGPDKEEPEQGRAELVKEKIEEVKAAKKHFAADFKRMKWCQDFARGKQYEGQASFEDEDRYILNIVQQHVKRQVAKLYAKNPTPLAKPADKLVFQVWDGTMESLQAAQVAMQQGAAVAQTGMAPTDPADPAAQQMQMVQQAVQEAQALMADIQQGIAEKKAMTGLGKTLEILCKYSMRQQQPNFKRSMKQMTRRMVTAGVGYVKLGFQRQLQGDTPDMLSRIADMNAQIGTLEVLKAELTRVGADYGDCEKEIEQYRIKLAAVQAEKEIVIREGLLVDFPMSTRVIPDKECTALDTWAGARWVAEEFLYTPKQIKQLFKVDLAGKFTAYTKNGKPSQNGNKGADSKSRKDEYCCLWEIYDIEDGVVYIVIDGYDDFLEEPAAPKVKLSRFFPIYAIAPNQSDHDEKLFPESDVSLIRHPQTEYNKKRESARQHRIANRPLYATPAGALGDKDVESLAGYAAHSVISMQGLKDGDDVGKLLQPVQKVPMEGDLYETQSNIQDVMLAAGSQESDLGPTSDATATEVTNAATSRASVIASNTDDMDDLLSDVFKGMGEIFMGEMSVDTVIKIVGRGAIWADEFTAQQIYEDMWLEVKGGTSGRPNKDQDAANLERLIPLALQVPGIRPGWLAKKLIDVVDDQVDIEDAYLEGLPAMVAQNSMAQPGTGDPSTDPNQQGGQGAQNAPNNDQSTGAPQGMFPNQAPAQ